MAAAIGPIREVADMIKVIADDMIMHGRRVASAAAEPEVAAAASGEAARGRGEAAAAADMVTDSQREQISRGKPLAF